MEHAKPLPPYLVTRYAGWKAISFAENKSWYKHLAEEGQHPRVMLISCCDSRVNGISIFGADQGEFFVHRNIANFVPKHTPSGDYYCTSAALEYAVQVLKVAHLIVLGHSGCGGVKGCLDMCEGHAPELEKETSFVGRWISALRPSFDRTSDIKDPCERQKAMEQASVVVSLENLMSFPFVAEAVREERLSLHGTWTDIGDGGLYIYQPEAGAFLPA